MPFDPKRPYNDLPPLPPKADIETKAILKACISARAALTELRQAAKAIPNPAILINSIPLLEAKDSSAIENIVTTADELFRQAEMNEASADPATKEALRYRTALNQGYLKLRDKPLTTNTAIEICRTIKGVEIDIRTTPGTALRNDRTGEIIYTPPEGETRLREMLGNWERFMHEARDIDPLIRMAVQHYQFEAIHPFTDGNGRTGRIINVLFLIEQNLLDLPVLYLSSAILKHRDGYYRGLLEVSKTGSWESWIIFMLRLTEATSLWTRAKIISMQLLMMEVSVKIKQQAPKIYSKELVEIIFSQPYCRIGNLVRSGIAQRQTASIYLAELARLGILNEQKIGRERLFINDDLLNLLKQTEFTPAQTAGT